jgi:uncharacterized protein YbbC (DUF1343 family)
MNLIVLLFCLLITFSACNAQNNVKQKTLNTDQEKILSGAERINVYLPLIKGRKVGIFANQTSMVGNSHLVDTLRKLGVNIKVIFGPEHGFRGTASAGEKIGNYTDEKTGIPVISLYGNKRRPSPEDLKDVDLLIFDIQDVGVRFYTYISSLQEYMEAAFENSKPLMILDRPNPNGFYVDGPVLDTKFKSFIGMQPIPIVYGMTIGEYAFMIAGEKWLSEKANAKHDYYRTAQNSPDTPFHFQVIKCQNYTHTSKYVLPVKPSPNIPEIQSIYLYPSTCLFEGTALSEGRGTEKPFQIFGHPSLPKNLYQFVPKPNEGAKSSKHYFQTCYGWNLHGTPEEVLKKVDGKIQLKWLFEAYRLFPGKDSFFLKSNFFYRLAGNDILMQQIKDGKTEEEIRKSWEPALGEFKKIRKKYLLYTDFE